MRTTQHFDAANVEDVEDGTLRAGDIDVIDIKADTGFEPPKRVLLTDAADEADQRRVRSARDLKRHIGRLVLQSSDVDSTLCRERFARNCTYRDRDVEQAFLTAAGGYDDFAFSDFERGFFLGSNGGSDH